MPSLFDDTVWGLQGTPYAVNTTQELTPRVTPPPASPLQTESMQPMQPTAQNPYGLQMSQTPVASSHWQNQYQAPAPAPAPAEAPAFSPFAPRVFGPLAGAALVNAAYHSSSSSPSYNPWAPSASGSQTPTGNANQTPPAPAPSNQAPPTYTVTPGGIPGSNPNMTPVGGDIGAAATTMAGLAAGPVGALVTKLGIKAYNQYVSSYNEANAHANKVGSDSMHERQLMDDAAVDAAAKAESETSQSPTEAPSNGSYTPGGGFGTGIGETSNTTGDATQPSYTFGGGSQSFSYDSSNSDSSDNSSSGDSSGYYKGGKVTKDRLRGPNPKGPDEGYGALQSGEFVVPKHIVKAIGLKYFQDLVRTGKK